MDLLRKSEIRKGAIVLILVVTILSPSVEMTSRIAYHNVQLTNVHEQLK